MNERFLRAKCIVYKLRNAYFDLFYQLILKGEEAKRCFQNHETSYNYDEKRRYSEKKVVHIATDWSEEQSADTTR